MSSLIDLYSDTCTRPCPGMRKAMASAEVGDEQKREDPTTNLLQERVAELLGKEQALFLPSGTMCNQIALKVHCRPGEEVIAHESSHIINYETGGPAANAGVMVRPVRGEKGFFSVETLERAISPIDNHLALSRMLSIENTTNRPGGYVWNLGLIEQLCTLAKEKGLFTHMDGARLLNASASSGISAADYAQYFDSVWIDFSKGLGAPVGAVIAGSSDFIEQAWRYKHQLGGALRQSGIIASAALYALDNNSERLVEDHQHALVLANALKENEKLMVNEVQTNIVIVDCSETKQTASHWRDQLYSQGVEVSVMDDYCFRLVTHLDVNEEQIGKACDIIKKTFGS